MDSFSASDSLRALCAPLCCCLRGSVALSPSTDPLAHFDESAEQHAQDARLWPRNETSNELDGTLYSTEYEARIASANGGLQAPQDSTPQAGGRFPRSRQRRRGGDISGGGTDDGSGLTRWTLFRSWLRGGNQVEGAIRLGEAEDEGDFVARTNESSPNRLFGYAYGDEDAAPIALDDVALPPAPPHRAGPVPGALAPPPPSSSDLTSSDDRSNLDGEEAAQKEERRRRRRLRRRARELGLSVEDYEARIGAGWIDETQAETAGSHLAAAPSQPSTSSSRRSHRSAPDLDDSGAPGSGLAPEISATTLDLPPQSRSSSSGERRSHSSNQSVSSHATTTSSSSSSRRRSRKHEEQTSYAAPRSPLEGPTGEYYEDEHGQLRERTEATGSRYDHIGVLPGNLPEQ